MDEPENKRAVALLSGGLDSATVVALAQAAGYRVAALSFAYGQRHAAELVAARRVAEAAAIKRHVITEIDLRAFGGSALTDDIEVPKGRADAEIGAGVPVTYVPARNTIFLAHALALAEVEGAANIFIGVNALDYSGYPDCRPEYIAAFETMANLATKAAVEGAARVKIQTPLAHMTKADIVQAGLAIGVDYGLTFSCYDPPATEQPEDGPLLHCGECDACLLRKKGFREAGVSDPTRYAV